MLQVQWEVWLALENTKTLSLLINFDAIAKEYSTSMTTASWHGPCPRAAGQTKNLAFLSSSHQRDWIFSISSALEVFTNQYPHHLFTKCPDRLVPSIRTILPVTEQLVYQWPNHMVLKWVFCFSHSFNFWKQFPLDRRLFCHTVRFLTIAPHGLHRFKRKQ